MSAAPPLEVVGGDYQGLLRAAELVRDGIRVDVVEPALRAGRPFLTESFLTPFRFNLGPALVPRPRAGALRTLEPDPLLAVGTASLGRKPRELAASGDQDVDAALDAGGVDDVEQRALLAAFALLSGIDPRAPGSGRALADALAGLPDLVAVAGGNGLLVAALVDEIVAGSGRVLEGVGAPRETLRRDRGLGFCRLFVGLRRTFSTAAFATGYGFGAGPVATRLDELEGGGDPGPVGFVLDNAHLDPVRPGDALGSFVWQGILPFGDGAPSRGDYTAAVLAAVGVAERDVVFRLLWLPEETGEALGARSHI